MAHRRPIRVDHSICVFGVLACESVHFRLDYNWVLPYATSVECDNDRKDVSEGTGVHSAAGIMIVRSQTCWTTSSVHPVSRFTSLQPLFFSKLFM